MVASRIALEMKLGHEIPDGMLAIHSCDNPRCVNPAHLRPGTHLDNTQDAIERGRHKNPPPPNGNPNPPKGAAVWNASLDEPTVREIWRLHFAGRNATQIGEAVGHPAHVVFDVCRGRSWRHLPDAPTLQALKAGGVRRNKLSDADKQEALRLIAAGWTNKAIGNKFGVSAAPISYLRTRGRTW